MRIENFTRRSFSLVVETREEAKVYADCYGGIRAADEPERYLEILTSLPATYEVHAHRSYLEGNGGWGRAVVATDYLDPYWRTIEERTGCGPFDVDLMPAFRPIYHTHQVNSFRYDAKAGCAFMDGAIQAWAGNDGWFVEPDAPLPEGRRSSRYGTFDQAVEARLFREAQKHLGEEPHEHEFIQSGNGGYFRNPDYASGRQKPIVKCARNEDVLWVLWDSWLATRANPAQVEVAGRHSTYRNGPTRPGKHDYQGFHIDNYTKHVKWADFATMTVAPPVEIPVADPEG